MENLKPITDKIDELVRPIARPQLIRYVAIYNIVVGVLSVCFGPILGALTGMTAVIGTAVSNQANGSSELAQAGQELAAVGGQSMIFSLLLLVSGVVLLVVGIGLLRRMSWSRRGQVLASGLGALASLLSFITGGGLMNLLWVVVDLALMYLFNSDAGIKAELGG